MHRLNSLRSRRRLLRLTSKSSIRDAALKAGWRSGLEESIAFALTLSQVRFTYETLTIPFTPKPKKRKYTPDFILLDNGIVVESKGRFVTADRQKHIEVKEQHPDLDIRFVFSNSKARISKLSKTTYALWCESKGFQFSDRYIPRVWTLEKPNTKSLAAIAALMKE